MLWLPLPVNPKDLSSIRSPVSLWCMNHLFRFFYLLLSFLWRPRLQMLDECQTHFRTWFTDLDLLMHMNNGKYLSLMDLGRVDLMLRCGAFFKAREQGIYPVLASATIRYRRSLQLFQPFVMKTKILCWDDKYFFIQQKFEVRGELYAQAMVRARFLKNSGGKVSPQEILDLIQIKDKSPAIPESVRLWVESERA